MLRQISCTPVHRMHGSARALGRLVAPGSQASTPIGAIRRWCSPPGRDTSRAVLRRSIHGPRRPLRSRRTRGPWPRLRYPRIARLVAAPFASALPARLRRLRLAGSRPLRSAALCGATGPPLRSAGLHVGRPRVRAFALSLLGSFYRGALRVGRGVPRSTPAPADRSSVHFAESPRAL